MIGEAIEIGKLLAASNLIDGASGNMSYREGDKIIITKRGVCLDNLSEKSFVAVDIDEMSEEASSDLIVHQEIYKNTDYKVVLHCHGVYNVVLSFKFDYIEPVDLEGKLYFGRISVVEGQFGTEELAKKIAEKIDEKGAAIVRGHGMYVADSSFRNAYNKASYIEHSCNVKYKLMLLNKP